MVDLFTEGFCFLVIVMGFNNFMRNFIFERTKERLLTKYNLSSNYGDILK